MLLVCWFVFFPIGNVYLCLKKGGSLNGLRLCFWGRCEWKITKAESLKLEASALDSQVADEDPPKKMVKGVRWLLIHRLTSFFWG